MHYPIALAERKISEALFPLTLGRWVERGLQREIQRLCTRGLLAAGREHLNLRHRNAHVLRQSSAAELLNGLHHALWRLAAHKEKIAVFDRQHRQLPGVYCVGIHNDKAFLRLTEDLREPDGLRHAAADEVRKEIARTNRRQLIRVADKNQPAAGLERTKQRRHELQINHRCLVDNHRLGLERLVLIVEKGHCARLGIKLRLKEPVDGAGLPPRHLAQALGSAPSRRCKLRLELHCVKEVEDARHDRRFARSGAARDDQKPVRSSRANRVQLQFGIGDDVRAGNIVQNRSKICGRACSLVRHLQNALRDKDLRLVQLRQIAG